MHDFRRTFATATKELGIPKEDLSTLLNHSSQDVTDQYVFASLDNCFVFWVNMEPDKFIEFIDGGSIAKDQGMWRKD